MTDLKKDILTCPNCGAPINRLTMRCEYCGAVFKEYMPNVLIRMENPKIVPLCADACIENFLVERIPQQKIAEIVSSQLANKIADGLTELMEIQIREDPVRMCTWVRGRIRIVPPGEEL